MPGYTMPGTRAYATTVIELLKACTTTPGHTEAA